MLTKKKSRLTVLFAVLVWIYTHVLCLYENIIWRENVYTVNNERIKTLL